MDLTAATTELQARGFSYLSSARCTTFLNLGKNNLESVAAWPWLETTTTGTAPLTISDLREILYVTNTTNHCQILGVDVRAVIDSDPDLTTVGVPIYWWLDGSTSLKLWPTSTSVSLSVRYLKWSAELSAGSDTPLIPVRHHSVWIDFAAVEAYKDANKYDKAAQLWADLTQRQVPAMVDMYMNRNLQNPDYFRVTGVSVDG